MERIIFTLLCTLCACTSFAQTKNSFVITSDIPDLPDGIEVELETAEGSNYDEVARAVVQDGKFVLTGRLTHPTLCTLSTNNYKLLYAMESKEEPTWTYTPIFVSNTTMTVKADKYKYLASNLPISKHLCVTGGKAQADFNDFNQRKNDSLTWMKKNPQSPLAIKMATEMVLNNRTLTKRQIEDITATRLSPSKCLSPSSGHSKSYGRGRITSRHTHVYPEKPHDIPPCGHSNGKSSVYLLLDNMAKAKPKTHTRT